MTETIRLTKKKVEEATQIVEQLATSIPEQWDGRACLLELRAADFQWRQMEWIGWWFEWKARSALAGSLGGTLGVRVGNTTFDYQLQFVWDLKAHVVKPTGKDWAILNDSAAIREGIVRIGGWGAILCCGDAALDPTGEFKRWHDDLKGGASKYERERLQRGAHSRTRKRSFSVREYRAIHLDLPLIEVGFEEGWLAPFQQGMRNADGSARAQKFMIDLRSRGSQQATLVHRRVNERSLP